MQYKKNTKQAKKWLSDRGALRVNNRGSFSPTYFLVLLDVDRSLFVGLIVKIHFDTNVVEQSLSANAVTHSKSVQRNIGSLST